MIKKLRTQLQKGFTILEMLMVLAIFTVITAVVIFNYSEFNSKTILSNMAYEVALSVRQAQVYSLGVRGQANLDNFNTRYGIHINTGINDKSLIFFVDKDDAGEPDNACDAGNSASCITCSGNTECLEKINLTRDVTVARICTSTDVTVPPVDATSGFCVDGEDSTHEELTLLFKRPNPDAIVTVGTESLTDVSTGIVLKTSYGNQRAVIISPTGQITVQVVDNAQDDN